MPKKSSDKSSDRSRGARKERSPVRSAAAILIACPDCAGVLSMTEDGIHNHRSYWCQIGHRYSTRSLIDAKEEQLEEALWAVSSLLVHIQIVYDYMQREVSRFNGKTRGRLQRRIVEARRQRRAVEELIRRTHAWDG